MARGRIAPQDDARPARQSVPPGGTFGTARLLSLIWMGKNRWPGATRFTDPTSSAGPGTTPTRTPRLPRATTRLTNHDRRVTSPDFPIPRSQRAPSAAGQLQHRDDSRPRHISYQHIFSERLLADVRFMMRTHDRSTPTRSPRHRGFPGSGFRRIFQASALYHRGLTIQSRMRPTSPVARRLRRPHHRPSQFDPGTPPAFQSRPAP